MANPTTPIIKTPFQGRASNLRLNSLTPTNLEIIRAIEVIIDFEAAFCEIWRASQKTHPVVKYYLPKLVAFEPLLEFFPLIVSIA